jgi:hypothetical protein
VVKALRYGLQVTLHERAEVIARKTQETGCFVLLTNVPTAGAMAHRAGDVLRAYKEQHGIEQNYGFLKDPLIVNSLFLKKPERIEALGLVLLLAAVDGVGQEGHAEADSLHADDQVCRGDGDQSGGPAPARPPSVDRPTAIPRGTACPCHLLHRSPKWIMRR